LTGLALLETKEWEINCLIVNRVRDYNIWDKE
jgi:hypothetical protein